MLIGWESDGIESLIFQSMAIEHHINIGSQAHTLELGTKKLIIVNTSHNPVIVPFGKFLEEALEWDKILKLDIVLFHILAYLIILVFHEWRVHYSYSDLWSCAGGQLRRLASHYSFFYNKKFIIIEDFTILIFISSSFLNKITNLINEYAFPIPNSLLSSFSIIFFGF